MCLTPVCLQKRTVPCGTCSECRSSHRASWANRLDYEAMYSNISLFITLTYDDNNLCFADGANPVLNFKDLRDYFKRVRKENPFLVFKYFAVGEYGEKFGRPHYHFIAFIKTPLFNDEAFRQKWFKGSVHIKPANLANIRYVLKDMLKLKGEFDHLEKELRPQIRVSKGLGIDYVKVHKTAHKTDVSNPSYYPLRGESKTIIPRYLRNKIFSKLELELQSITVANQIIAKQRNISSQKLHENSVNYYEKVFRANKKAQQIRHSNKSL